jgi:hypothetical protein
MDDNQASKIGLGKEVMLKRLGPPGMGIVVGVILATVWEKFFAGNRNLTHWDSYYPNWRQFMVCQVLFKEPQKPYTYQEFVALLPNASDISESELKTLYKYNVQYAKIVSYPIEDLELME